MSSRKHIVLEQGGVSIHREIPCKRTASEYDLEKIGDATKTAFKKVCMTGNATPSDYRQVLSSILGRELLDEVLK